MQEKYICAFCGAEYDTPITRAKCELECDEKRKQEAERQRQFELANAREARWQEILQKEHECKVLLEKYIADYGVDFSRGRTVWWL